MTFEATNIEGVWVQTPVRHTDGRGTFEEQFKLSLIEGELRRGFTVRQINQSVSSKGVIRGIHFTESLEGQAKYVFCSRGRIWDVVVDLRRDSATFGTWLGVELSPENGKGVFISEGIGHAFLSLEEGSVVNYLCSSEFDPDAERAVNALSPSLGITFDSIAKENSIQELKFSEKDSRSTEFQPK
jgi:dTDP-4-dehydrorhamnose 3,5-epimerase